MKELSTCEQDGSQALPLCLAHRAWLVDCYKVDGMIALRYFSDELPVLEKGVDSDRKSIAHIRKCPKCREWINHTISPSIMRRQQRLSRYCCSGMFVAYEEPNNKNRIEFELFRGEDPCWKIDGIRAFISFCPWCGKKLPNKPFIQD